MRENYRVGKYCSELIQCTYQKQRLWPSGTVHWVDMAFGAGEHEIEFQLRRVTNAIYNYNGMYDFIL